MPIIPTPLPFPSVGCGFLLKPMPTPMVDAEPPKAGEADSGGGVDLATPPNAGLFHNDPPVEVCPNGLGEVGGVGTIGCWLKNEVDGFVCDWSVGVPMPSEMAPRGCCCEDDKGDVEEDGPPPKRDSRSSTGLDDWPDVPVRPWSASKSIRLVGPEGSG